MSTITKTSEHRYYLTYVTGPYGEILIYTFGVLPKDDYEVVNTQNVIECNISLSENERITTEFYTSDNKDYSIFRRKLELLEVYDIPYSSELAVVYPTESEDDN